MHQLGYVLENRDWTKCLLCIVQTKTLMCKLYTLIEGFVYVNVRCALFGVCVCVRAGNDTESGELELVQLAVHNPGDANSEGLYDYTLDFTLEPKWKGTLCDIHRSMQVYWLSVHSVKLSAIYW